jgi:hypothetical protein
MNKFESKIEDVYAALLRGEGSAGQIAARAKISASTATNNLNRLREAGRAYVVRWEAGPPPSRVWMAGSSADAVKPEPMTPEETRRRHKEMQRERRNPDSTDSGDRVAYMSKARTYAFIERVRTVPQSWCSPLEVA